MEQPKKPQPDATKLLLTVLRVDAYLVAPALPFILYFLTGVDRDICAIVGGALFISAQVGIYFIKRYPEAFGGSRMTPPPNQSEEL